MDVAGPERLILYPTWTIQASAAKLIGGNSTILVGASCLLAILADERIGAPSSNTPRFVAEAKF
jgi:hypothetical protein